MWVPLFSLSFYPLDTALFRTPADAGDIANRDSDGQPLDFTETSRAAVHVLSRQVQEIEIDCSTRLHRQDKNRSPTVGIILHLSAFSLSPSFVFTALSFATSCATWQVPFHITACPLFPSSSTTPSSPAIKITSYCPFAILANSSTVHVDGSSWPRYGQASSWTSMVFCSPPTIPGTIPLFRIPWLSS